jgi:hypothetical protein
MAEKQLPIITVKTITLFPGPVWKRQRKSDEFKDRLHYLRLFGMKWYGDRGTMTWKNAERNGYSPIRGTISKFVRICCEKLRRTSKKYSLSLAEILTALLPNRARRRNVYNIWRTLKMYKILVAKA